MPPAPNPPCRGTSSLGTITNGDVLEVWATHSLIEELPFTLVLNGREILPEEYILLSFQPLRLQLRPWVTDHLCGGGVLDESASQGRLQHLHNSLRAEANLTEPSNDLCNSSQWIMIFFQKHKYVFAYYSHFTFAVRQAPAFDVELLGNHQQEFSPVEWGQGSDIKAFPCVRPVWDAEDLPEELHNTSQNGMDGSFRFTSYRAISSPHNRHSNMRLELQAVSCCKANGALFFHGTKTALHKELSLIDPRLQEDNVMAISDPLHHYNQEAVGRVVLFPTKSVYSEGKCAHIITKTAYLFSAASFTAGYWCVHAATYVTKRACRCMRMHANAHVTMWQVSFCDGVTATSVQHHARVQRQRQSVQYSTACKSSKR